MRVAGEVEVEEIKEKNEEEDGRKKREEMERKNLLFEFFLIGD